MKFLRFSIFAMSLLGLVVLSACGDDEEPPEEASNEAILAENVWVITSTKGSVSTDPSVTVPSNATATLEFILQADNSLNYSLTTNQVPAPNGVSNASMTGSFTLNGIGSATLGSGETVTILSSPLSVANSNTLSISYDVSDKTLDDAYKNVNTVTLNLEKR